jgi:translation initiation factor 2 beta subunit (eIF-2beta)/eIF-5
MKKQINIDISNPDPFYRYKMPAIIIAHRRQRTYIENIEEIFKCLTKYDDNQKSRKYDEIMKWISYQMASNVKENFLSGEHSDEKLIGVIHDYILHYVLCSSCSNPETTLFVLTKNLFTHCKACGKDCQINNKFSKYNAFLVNVLK